MKLKKLLSTPKGLSLIELILAMAIFSIISGAIISLVLGSYSANLQSSKLTRATYYIQGTEEALRSLGSSSWNSLPSGEYGLSEDGDQWELSEDPDVINDQFTRTITIEDTDNIHERKITTNIAWDIWEGRSVDTSSEIYLANYIGSELEETDWSDPGDYDTDDGHVDTSTSGQVSLDSTSTGLTMEVGELELDPDETITMESLTTSADSSSWTSVSFNNSDFTDPIVVCSQTEVNNSLPASIRLQNISSTGFEVILQSPGGSLLASEDIACLAVERGSWHIDGYWVEADSLTSSTVSAAPSIGGTWAGDNVNFTANFSRIPIVLHQVQTYNDSTWISSWVSRQGNPSLSPNVTGFQTSLNGAQATTIHDPEDIGWIALQRDFEVTINDIDVEVQLQENSVTGHDDGCDIFSYNQVDSSQAFTIVSQQDMGGGDGGWSVICEQNDDSVGVHIDEDQQFDSERNHLHESIGFVSFSETTQDTFDEGWTTINLEESYTSPVIIATLYNNYNITPLVARLNNISSNSFDITLQRGDSSTGHTEDLHYMVIEEGDWSIGSLQIEAHKDVSSLVGSQTGGWVGDDLDYNLSYSDFPILLHQVQTYNDSDWITSWTSYPSNPFGPVSRFKAQLGLNGAQVTTTHDPETIGWVVVETGDDTVESTDFHSEKSATEVEGYGTCYSQYYGAVYSNPIVLASQQEMDGGDGSWARGCEVTSTYAGFYAEEDLETDFEQSHATEILGFLAFDQPLSMNSVIYYSDGYLESNTFGPYDNFNLIQWTEDVPVACSDCAVKVQVKTSPDGITWSSEWSGPDGEDDGDEDDYYELSDGELIHSDHIQDQYIRYRATLLSDTTDTPILEDITINYYEY